MATVLFNRLKNFDEHLAAKFSGYSQNKLVRNSMKAFEYFFHGVPWFVFVIVSCLTMSNTDKFKILFLALLVDVISVGLLKSLIKRPRPKVNSTKDMAFLTNAGVDKFSFPSGHSSRAVLMCSLLPHLYATEINSAYSLFLLYFVSYMTCVSRFVLTRHYLSDVIAGILLGHFNYFIVLSLIPTYISF